MHETGSGHSADGLPFIADNTVTLDRVKGDVIESSEDIDLLRLEDRDCRVSTS